MRSEFWTSAPSNDNRMLSTTFLGHQGWLFQSKTSCFLVDPLLCEEFGQVHALEYRVYPPRVFSFEQFPKVDGVVLTHEHDDHFDIPSLARLERTIPIFLSSRSSTAAQRILREMGFTVHPLVPGKSVRFGDLEFTPFCGAHTSISNGDEWDTLPFFVGRTWLNHRVFCVDNAAVCQMMSRLYPKEQFHATRPGQTFLMEGHRLKRVFDDTPFLTTAPPETWPARGSNGKGEATDILDYAPATGRTEMESAEYAMLEQGLQEFAGSLVSGSIFRGLHSLLDDQAKGRIPTFAVALRDSHAGERRVYEYVYSACAVLRGTSNAEETYLAGIECWATDLLAVLKGELGPIALSFGRARLWNALSEQFLFDFFGDLYRMSHPLRRPAEYLRTYQRLWTKSANPAPTIFHR